MKLFHLSKMMAKFSCWTCGNYVIISVVLLITKLIWVQADIPSQPEFARFRFLLRLERAENISSNVSEKYCSAVITHCPSPLNYYKFCPDRFYSNITKKCNSNYTDMETIEKCQDFMDSDLLNKSNLFLPKISSKTNVIYANDYCSICNFENTSTPYRFWTPLLFFKIDKKKSPNTKFKFKHYTRIDSSEVLDGLKVRLDVGYGSSSISIFSNEMHLCTMLNNMSNFILNQITACFNVKGVSIDVQQTITGEVWHVCLPELVIPSLQLCHYADKYGDICTTNKFLNKIYYTCDENGYIVEHESSEDKGILLQCSNHTFKENYMYVCGPKHTHTNRHWVTTKMIFNVGSIISSLFLFLYLWRNMSKENLKKLPNRIIYSYSVSVLIFYCGNFFGNVKSCEMQLTISIYRWQSYSFWILIAAFDLCRHMYNSLRMKQVNVEGQTKRFLVYCIIGWGLPVLFSAVSYYLIPIEDNEALPCPSVAGFKSIILKDCLEENTYGFFSVYSINMMVMRAVILDILTPCLLAVTFGFIYLSSKNKARSSANRTYSKIFLKIAILMGSHWMLINFFITLMDSEEMTISIAMIMSLHGCYVFFAFGLKKTK